MKELSLAVVGVAHPNKRGPTRLFAIQSTSPGDPITLVREPKNPADVYAIMVHNERGEMMGYLTAERAAWLAPMLDRGRVITAVFQGAASFGAYIRAAFDGKQPTLPPPQQLLAQPDDGADPESDFYPDDEWPDE